MEKNKVTFGLQDVHWAEVTKEAEDGALTYGNVERLRGAAELTLEPQGDSGSYKADNINFYTSESNDGYEGTLKLALLTQGFLTRVLGETLMPKVKSFQKSLAARRKTLPSCFALRGIRKRRYMFSIIVMRADQQLLLKPRAVPTSMRWS